MIFVTTGTQEPFDRLIKAVDSIAKELPEVNFCVQAFTSEYKAVNFKVSHFLTSKEFDDCLTNAQLIISHAGMGTVISALVKNKAIIIMPRLLKFNEHRNEHQLATAKKLDELSYVNVAYNEDELMTKFFEVWPNNLETLHQIGDIASKQLINSLESFIKQ